MPAIVLRLCFLLLLFAAAPAQAIVCTVYDTPLTQEQVERFAAQTRDGYPAKYRAMLDAVKVTLIDSPSYNLALVSGPKGSEMIVPASYLRTNCLLAMGAYLFDGDAQERRAKGKKSEFTLPPCPQLSKRECLMGELDKSLRRSSGQPNEEALADMFREMIESGLRFAMAHEYGHVIADAEPGPRPRDYDAEAAADMLTLHTIASSAVVPLSDTFLFAGQVLNDTVTGGPSGAVGPHEATICRARRSVVMRQRLLPTLLQVMGWSRSDMAFGKQLPQLAGVLTGDFTFAPAAARCSLKLPAEVTALEQDLKRLVAAVADFPAPTQLDEAQLAAIQRVQVRSRVGLGMRNAIYGGVSAVRVAKLGGALTGQSVAPEERRRLMDELARIDRLPALTDMSSREYRDFLYVRAIGHFASTPPGARYADQVATLRRELDQANAYGQPQSDLGLFDGVSLFMLGDCRLGMERMLQANSVREALLKRTQMAFQMYGVRLPEVPAELRDMIAYGQSLQAENKQVPEDRCREMTAAMQARMRSIYGWAD